LGTQFFSEEKIAPLLKELIPSSFGKAYLRYALSVLLRITDSDYPFGVFKLFACHAIHISKNKEFLLLFICFSNRVLLAYSKTIERKRNNT
jgi:hypothetical protein